MDITLYKCSSENNRLDKTGFLSDALVITGANIKGVFAVDAPELVLYYAGDLAGYNYAKCAVNGVDYYYYAKISGETGQRMTATLTRDPLQSFAPGIAVLPILGARCEQQAITPGSIGYNGMLVDPQQQFLAPVDIQRKPLMSFTWSQYWTLVTVG